jgi:hypothetical protein
MPLYTFYLRDPYKSSTGFEAYELPTDGDAFEQAGGLLERHYSADYIEVWEANRPVVARHREQPIIRPLQG